MKVDFSLYDRFYILPRFWKMSRPFSGERARYFGHTWAWTIHWLGFELLAYGVPQ